tara:strand:- start:416 stop:982 length:567 start_codon:yes stop_codon:yes gene_type:complete
MKKMMAAFIGMDYQRGLTMLKDHLETGVVPSKLCFRGGEAFPGFKYIAIRTTSSLDAMGESMVADLTKLSNWFESSNTEPSGKPFSIYHKFNRVKGVVKYTVGIPVAGDASDLPSDFISGEMPSHQSYAIGHVGPYRHLGNAWSAGMMRSRNKVFKQSKKLHPFEVYDNDPNETAEDALETSIYFPIA